MLQVIKTRYSVILASPSAFLGLVIVTALVTIACFWEFIVPYPQHVAGAVDAASRFQAPSLRHLFGTNDLGQDVLSLTLAGTRVSIFGGIAVVLLGAFVGAVIGAIAGFFGGWLDEVLMRFTDLTLTIPSLILSMAIAAALGPGIVNMVLAIAFTWWPGYARLVRGEVRARREDMFVMAARLLGASPWRQLRVHIIPNLLAPVMVKFSLDIGFAILTVGALGFIGIGVKPPTPELGQLLSTARANMPDYWWTAVFPGIAIFLEVFGANLLGDGVRDLLDPRSGG
jgi:peptide/nickel transport system permease protein